MSDITTLVLTAAFSGLCVGIVGYRAYVLWRLAKFHAEHREMVFTNVLEHIHNNIFIAYPERDEKTGRYRIFEVGTHKFLAQGDTAAEFHEAFFDRYPDKQFVLIHTDENLAREMGTTIGGEEV